ncbi:hypothetical protein Ancab_019503, partial [Ancistrocladus abbreviatus]
IAVVFAETITSSFMVLVMTCSTNSPMVDTCHAGAMTIMFTWNYVYRKKYYYEVDHKVSSYQLRDIAAQSDLCRIPGLTIFDSELVHRIPSIFEHYASNIPAVHSVLIFVSFKSLVITHKQDSTRGKPRELYVFRCVVRYGYTDVHQEGEPFERLLIERVKDFVREQYWLDSLAQRGKNDSTETEAEGDEDGINNSNDEERQGEREGMNNGELEKEIEVLEKAYKAGVVYLMGESEVVARKGAGLGKKVFDQLWAKRPDVRCPSRAFEDWHDLRASSDAAVQDEHATGADESAQEWLELAGNGKLVSNWLYS